MGGQCEALGARGLVAPSSSESPEEGGGGGGEGERTAWTKSPEDTAPVSAVASVIGSAAVRRRLPEGTARPTTS